MRTKTMSGILIIGQIIQAVYNRVQWTYYKNS